MAGAGIQSGKVTILSGDRDCVRCNANSAAGPTEELREDVLGLARVEPAAAAAAPAVPQTGLSILVVKLLLLWV